MTERDLENIITAYDEGSFLKAAEKLYVTQSALSQSIRKLESQLGGKLFLCKGNRVEPTALCRDIVTLGRPVYFQWLDFQKKAGALAGKRKDSVTVVSNEAILTSLLFPAIQRFKLTHDDISFQILERKSREAETDLAEGRADLGIYPSRLEGNRIVSVPILPTEYFLAVPEKHPYSLAHPYTGMEMAGVADLCDLKPDEFVFPRQGSRAHAEQMSIFAEAGFTPKTGMETATVNTLINYVQSGLYLALIKSCYAGSYSDLSGISYYRLDLESARGFIYACHPASGRLTPDIEELLREIRHEAGV